MSVAVLELIDPDDPDRSSARWDVEAVTIVGRGGESSVVLNVPAVSRHHVQLTPRPQGWVASDLDSRNGTFLNGVALDADPVALHDGDVLVLAGAVSIRFRDPLATPIAPAIGRLIGVWIDPETAAVWIDARRLEPPLSGRQLRLLQCLHDAEGEIVTRQQAIEAVWDDAHAEGVTDDALAALTKRLRRRLEEYETAEPWIEIIRHRGLRLRIVE